MLVTRGSGLTIVSFASIYKISETELLGIRSGFIYLKTGKERQP